MGYKNIRDEIVKQQSGTVSQVGGTIVLLTHREAVGGSSYWSGVIRGIETALRGCQYNLSLVLVTPDDELNDVIPPAISSRSCQGIIIQGLFPPHYYRAVASYDIPMVSLDIANELIAPNMLCDVVSTHNSNSIHMIVSDLIKKGHTKIGFVGDIHCCKGYFERWRGYVEAMHQYGLEVSPKFCCTDRISDHYLEQEGARAALDQLLGKVSAIVCANDSIAVHMICMLQQRGIKVPDDICISGFDNIEESMFLSVGLTTVDGNNYELGYTAGEQIVWRISHVDRPYRTIKVSSQVIVRESTNYKINK